MQNPCLGHPVCLDNGHRNTMQALMALRDYIPVHIYNSASAHLFGPEELKSAPAGPQLRPEYATLRAYAAGNIEVRAQPVQPSQVIAPLRGGSITKVPPCLRVVLAEVQS